MRFATRQPGMLPPIALTLTSMLSRLDTLPWKQDSEPFRLMLRSAMAVGTAAAPVPVHVTPVQAGVPHGAAPAHVDSAVPLRTPEKQLVSEQPQAMSAAGVDSWEPAAAAKKRP